MVRKRCFSLKNFNAILFFQWLNLRYYYKNEELVISALIHILNDSLAYFIKLIINDSNIVTS